MPLLRCQQTQAEFDWTPKAPESTSASPPTRLLGRADYEERRAARTERLRAHAERLRRVAEGAHARAREIGSHIPFGQPVLVGHHSQRRHERDIERIDRSMRKSIEASREARDYERRAASSERNRAISSDDPEAVRRLKEKLAELKRTQERMKAGNKALREGKNDEQIARVTGLSPMQAAKLREKDFAGRVGFPNYAIKNNSAEIRRVEKRIGELHKTAATPVRASEHIGAVTIREEDNRVKLIFQGKPSDAVIRELKGNGFRWSPTAGAWQRHASTGAWYHARRIAASA